MTRVSPQKGSSGIVVREPAAASNAHEFPEELAAVKGGDAVFCGMAPRIWMR